MILLCFFIELFESGVLGLELGDDFLHQANHVRNDDGAADGVKCMEMLEKAPAHFYDLILMDIQMPILGGYDTTRKIRRMADAEKAAIPIIAMTANAFAEDKQRALVAGMNDHVAKPIDMNKLIPTLQKYI